MNKHILVISVVSNLYLFYILLFSTVNAAQFYPGLPTRSQNPMLQGYFIPAMPAATTQEKWSFSHSLYFTNTYQRDKSTTEELIIDVENTRYDFQVNHTHNLWLFNINASLIRNQSGFLDQVIEDWHDFFGLPQGGRNQAQNDRIHLLYQKDGLDIINSHQVEEGIGDVQLAAGYQLNTNSQFWFAVELPASSTSEFISNKAIDIAAWYSAMAQPSSKLTRYGSIGVALPADNGLLENHLNNQFMFGQFGFNYIYNAHIHILLQVDIHSQIIKQSHLDAFDSSLQTQLGLRFPSLINNHQLELFFSEDIFPGHAPDITFGLRVSATVN